MEKVKLPSIKSDADIKISISQAVYKEISTSYFILMHELSDDEREQFLKEIKNEEGKKTIELSNAKFQPISTLVYLMAYVEKSAKEQDQIEEIEVDKEELKKQLESISKG